MPPEATIEVAHDDQPNEVIDKVNAALQNADAGFQFVDDEGAYEGKVVYVLRKQ